MEYVCVCKHFAECHGSLVGILYSYSGGFDHPTEVFVVFLRPSGQILW